MSHSVSDFYEFGPFRIDVANRLVLRDGAPLALTPKAVETLLALVRHSGEILRKDELLTLVWPETAVDEGNLTQNIYLLRKTLGEGYIETVPRRGYRFVGDVRSAGNVPSVRDVSDSPDPAVPARRPWSRPFLLAAAVAIVAIAALASLTMWAWPRPGRPATTRTIDSVAVLPFEPLTAGSVDVETLGVGIADALINELTSVNRLIVRPTSAVLEHGGPARDRLAAARALQVDTLLDGRFQRVEGRLRVTVQLIRARDGVPLWAGTFDEPFTSVLAVQDAMARRVADAVALKLRSGERDPLAKRLTDNPDAYRAYVRGQSSWRRRTTPALEDAIAHFEQALRDDPDYAPAYAGLADAYAKLASRYSGEDQSPADALPKAKAAALKAILLDDRLAEAHAALGIVKYQFDGDGRGAEIEFKRALALNPADAHAHHVYALYLSAMGRPDEARAALARAQELSPLSFSINRGLGDILYRAREYDHALEQFRRTLRLDPDDPMAFSVHRTMGWAYEYQGRHAQAVEEFLEALRLQEAKPESLSALRQAYDAAGIKGYWRKWLELHADRIARGRINPFNLAQVYAFLGENDRAFAYLQQACENRSVTLPALRSGPHFDDLRPDPRYAMLLRRAGLTP